MLLQTTVSWRLAGLGFAALVAASGCSRGGLQRVEVSGAVNYQGKPVEDGQIRFIPQGDTQGPLTIEPIKAGRYSASYNGGVPIGQHRIEIQSWDPKIPEPMGPGAPPRPQLLPPKYNVESELSITLDGESDAVQKDFEL